MYRYHLMRGLPRWFFRALPPALVLSLLFPSVALAATTGGASAQLDGPGFFSFLLRSLVDLGVVFWVGAQLWHAFVLQLSDEDGAESPIQQAIDREAEQRFLRRFSIPTLLLILLANLGVLLGQGNFGTYWLAREIVALLALVLTSALFRVRARARILDELLSWAYLLLALGMLIAMALSSDAATVANSVLVYSVLLDWLHLLAAALWIGGMLYLSLVYLPILRARPLSERTSALLVTLWHFLPLTIAGIIIMALSGPFNAAVHLQAVSQLVSTAYGRTLLVKAIFIVALLLTNASHIFFLRPQLARTQKQYLALTAEAATVADTNQPEPATVADTPDIKQLETRLIGQERRLTGMLRWEPLLGVAILLCASLLSVFVGSLQAVSSQPTQQQPTTSVFNTTVKTTDSQFTLQIRVTPFHFGENTFTVRVLDAHGSAATGVTATLYVTMLDMDMGTDKVSMQAVGNGQFTGQDAFSMAGHWQLRIQIQTPENAVHEAKVALTVPF